MMLFISLFALPLMFHFVSYGAYDNAPRNYFTQFSLGNMGGSNTFCAQSPLASDKSIINMRCSTGLLDVNAISTSKNKRLF